MRKIEIAIGVMILLVGAFVFYNKLYYPPLPIETMSKKEVIDHLNNSDEKMIPLMVENGKEWYIVNDRNQTKVDEIIIATLGQKDWVFKEKEGSGLFFEREGERLIVTSQQWTEKYSLVEIPVGYDE